MPATSLRSVVVQPRSPISLITRSTSSARCSGRIEGSAWTLSVSTAPHSAISHTDSQGNPSGKTPQGIRDHAGWSAMGRKDGRGAKRAVRATPKLFPEADEEAIRAKHPDPAQVPWAIKASSRLIDLQVRLNESATGIARIINPAPFGTQLWHTTVLDWATGRGGDVPHLAILMLEAEAIKRGVDLDGWELTDAARAREAAARADEMLRTIAHLDQVLPGEIEGLREELRSLS